MTKSANEFSIASDSSYSLNASLIIDTDDMDNEEEQKRNEEQGVRSHGDCETLMSAGRELMSIWIGTTLTVASTMDTTVTSNLSKEILGYSIPAAVAGGVFGAIAAAYTAKVQAVTDKHFEEPINWTRLRPAIDAIDQDDDSSTVADQNKNTYINSIYDFLTDSGDLKPGDVRKKIVAPIGIAGDLVGFSLGIICAADFSLNTKISIALPLIGLALYAARYSPVEIALNVMKYNNGKARFSSTDPHQTLSWASRLYLLLKLLQTAVEGMTLIAGYWDKVRGNQSDTFFDFSVEGMLVSLPYALVTTYFVIRGQYYVSLMTQGFYQEPEEENDIESQIDNQSEISRKENQQKLCSSSSTIVESVAIRAGIGAGFPAAFLFLAKDKLPLWLYTLLLVGGALYGVRYSYSSARTCEENKIKYWKKHGDSPSFLSNCYPLKRCFSSNKYTNVDPSGDNNSCHSRHSSIGSANPEAPHCAALNVIGQSF